MYLLGRRPLLFFLSSHVEGMLEYVLFGWEGNMLGAGFEWLHLARKKHLSFVVTSLIKATFVDTLLDEATANIDIVTEEKI